MIVPKDQAHDVMRELCIVIAVHLRGSNGATVAEALCRRLLPLLQAKKNLEPGRILGLVAASRHDRGTHRESASFEPPDRHTERFLEHGE